MNRIEQMRALLAAFQPTQIEIIDDSHKHAGHEGARSGGGHYTLHIVSAQFAGKSTLVRHRMIYSTLGEMMKHDIHALNIKAYTPEELQSVAQ
jgi:BolA protein